jgi:hypothetical protein
MNEAAAERLSPARAAELIGVLDLQSRWENLRAGGNHSTAQLQSLQTAFEAYRQLMAAYSHRDHSEPIPDLSPSGPSRLGAWCRTVRAVLGRAAEAECPRHIVEKAHRVASRIAESLKVEPLGRREQTDVAGAIRELDAIIAWCSSLAVPARDSAAVGAFEVGAAAGSEG